MHELSPSAMNDIASLLAERADDIDVVAAHFKGKRKSLFEDSIAVIRESVARGAWVKRGHQRADKGINKGLAAGKHLNSPGLRYDDPRHNAMYRVYTAIEFGYHIRGEDLAEATDEDLRAMAPTVLVEVARAWLRLMVAMREICADLDASRPLPVYTEIGLSPKVTATMQDIGLDLDLSSRRMAPIDSRWVQARNPETFEPIFDANGSPRMIKVYFVKWPDGTVFGSSRFADRDCEACGKTIPSRSFVPILIDNKAGKPHGFWFGCDCARNIFGIKDVGIARE